jgi:hypothetical protein
MKEQTFIGKFSDKLVLYTWDIVGLILIVGLIFEMLKLL